jgi:DNA-binding transcriptional regulator/RsmH inhibitor MraZ
MILPPDDNIFKEGFYKGCCEVTVDHGPRIRLPAKMLRILDNDEVKQIVIFPDPYGRRLIICPDKFYDQYVKLVVGDKKISLKPDRTYRKFICTAETIALQKPCRIQVRPTFNKYLNIKEGDVVIIIAVFFWFEIWKKSEWEKDSDAENEKENRSFPFSTSCPPMPLDSK